MPPNPAFSVMFLKSAIAAIAVETIGLADRAGLVMGHAIQRTGIDQKKVHQSVAVVIQPAPARAVGFQNVRNFCIAELVDELDAGLGGDILEQIIRPGRNRRRNGLRGGRRPRRAGGGPGGLSFDGDGDQHQAKADRGKGGDYADGTFAFHTIMQDAPARGRPVPGLEWQKANS